MDSNFSFQPVPFIKLDLDYDKVRETWETLTREQLKMLIIIYQTIDLNQDGLVDFNEM